MSDLIQQNISLKEFSNFKIGGAARYFLEFADLNELKLGLGEWENIKKEDPTVSDKIFVISGATNILFSDSGFDGLILHNKIDYIKKNSDELFEIGAGTSVEQVNDFCIENFLSGFEWSGGLPGSVGGAVFGNAGAFGGETKDSVLEVESYEYFTGESVSRSNSECKFGYRSSIFKSEKLPEIILNIKLNLIKGNQSKIKSEIEARIAHRQNRYPLEYPNIGSIFKNIAVSTANPEVVEFAREKIKDDPFPVIPVAYLIAQAGLIGTRVGGAVISEKHPNMIVNTDDALAADVLKIIEKVQNTLQKKYGVKPEPEVIILV